MILSFPIALIGTVRSPYAENSIGKVGPFSFPAGSDAREKNNKGDTGTSTHSHSRQTKAGEFLVRRSENVEWALFFFFALVDTKKKSFALQKILRTWHKSWRTTSELFSSSKYRHESIFYQTHVLHLMHCLF